jgi:hypothetical protein
MEQAGKIWSVHVDQVDDQLSCGEVQPESEPRSTPLISSYEHQHSGALHLEDFLPKHDQVSAINGSFQQLLQKSHTDSSTEWRLPDRLIDLSHLSPRLNSPSRVKSRDASADEPREPPQATPWASPSSEPLKAPTCGMCQNLQQQLLAGSAQSARQHTQRQVAMSNNRQVQEQHEAAQEKLEALRRIQAELADTHQVAEHNIQDICQSRQPTDAKWREEAGAWQNAYDTAKASASLAQQQCSVSELAISRLNDQVRALQLSLDDVQSELEDARASCGATEKRVIIDKTKLDEELAEARVRCIAEEAFAEAARSEAITAETRLSASCHRFSTDAVCRGTTSNGVLEVYFRQHNEGVDTVLAQHRTKADAEEQRCIEMQSEVSAWHQRVTSGRVALGRLQELSREASLQLELKCPPRKGSTTDRSCSPLASSAESAAVMELRARLAGWETKLQDLENENRQMRQLQQFDSERHAAKVERLRLKVERYKFGHADLQRLYLERKENL